jgi:hypothetical protein
LLVPRLGRWSAVRPVDVGGPDQRPECFTARSRHCLIIVRIIGLASLQRATMIGRRSLKRYGPEVGMMLEQNEKAARWAGKITAWTWVYLVILSTVFLVIGGMRSDSFQGLWFGIQACFWLLLGSTFLVTRSINQRGLETLKDLKGLERQLLELRRLIDARAERGSGPS